MTHDGRPVAEIRSLRVRYPDAEGWRPDGVDAALHPGEVLLVMGPSGCGKTSLALALDGLIPHALDAELEGSVTLAGVRTTESTVPRLSEVVAMVFQDPDAQIVTATVFDEVCFGPENLLVPAVEIERRAEAALRAVGLWERRGDDPAVLSGGGKQRLAIACALAMETRVLVLDEPTANLDPAGTEEVYRLLRELVAADPRRSIVLVEHDIDAALPIVDRILVLDRDGRPWAAGPATEVLRSHAEGLDALGVWLPAPTRAAVRLRRAGTAVEPLPVTAGELAHALSALDAPPTIETSEAPEALRPRAAAVSVRSLTVRRGRREVLHGLELTVEEGEFLAVVGPNGAGKSTLLQALAGIRRTPRGSVDIAGIDPSRASPGVRAAVAGFVFQNPEHQFVAETVDAELAVGLRRLGLPPGEVAARVEAMLEALELSDRRHVSPFRLSGGQKRRLSVGTALITQPEVLLLDEPTFGLDRARADEVMRLAAGRAGNRTTVVVTHELGLVAEYADRVAILDHGRIAAVGETASIIRGESLLAAHGLRVPPLARALSHPGMPDWLRGVTRLADLDRMVVGG